MISRLSRLDVAPPIEFRKPLTPDQQRTSPEFFKVLDFVLRFCPTHPSERALRDRFAKLGLGAGTFDVAALQDETRAAVAKGMSDAWEEFAEFKRTQVDTGKRTAADGFGTREYLKNDYLGRMSSAILGIYRNSKEEALYPIYFTDSACGKLDASRNRYTLQFPPGALPPVNAFWSLTMYELPSSLLVDNPLERYLINSPMLPSLKQDADGGLTLYLQHESPGDGTEVNWLPAPDGEFFAVLRLYWPKEQALTGAWKAPPLERVSGDSMKESAPEAVPVTVENFARAESDVSFEATVKGFNAFGKFHHNRAPTKLDEQAVIRMNRDTLYSAAVFDLDAGPVTITLPDAGGRFISMQVINQDHYTPLVTYGGTHRLTREAVGTRYVMTIVRTLADASNPADLAAAAKVQDAIRVEQPGGPGKFEIPRWDPVSRNKVRDALNVLADTLPDKNRMFGTKAEVDPVRYLLGVSSAWGGNPDKEAIYLNVVPKQNDGKTVHRMTVKDVPVDGFWSVCVYNAKGYFEPNPANAYVVNNVTAKKGADGSVTIQFGGDPATAGDGVNVLPITPGWNYMVRLYRPRKEILDGTWKFPEVVEQK